MSEQLYDVIPVDGEPSEVLDLRLTKAQARERMAEWGRQKVLSRCLLAGTETRAFSVELRSQSGALLSVHCCAFSAALDQLTLQRELGLVGLSLLGVWSI